MNAPTMFWRWSCSQVSGISLRPGRRRSHSRSRAKCLALAAWLFSLAWFAAPAGAARDACFGHADGALCSDGNPCTLNDNCQGGWCKGTVAPNGTDCADGNLCTGMDRCVAGACVGIVLPDGESCDDEDICTVGETCRRGVCRPQGPLQCSDNDPCTSESCAPVVGCVYAVVPMCPADAGVGGAGGMGGAGGAGGVGPSPDARADAPLEPDAQPDASERDAGGPLSDAAIAYEVEGGAWLCALQPGTSQHVGALPLLMGAAWLAGSLRKRRRHTDRLGTRR